MNELSTVMARLAGIRKAVAAAMDQNVSRNRSAGQVLTRTNFRPMEVGHYFRQAAAQVEKLKELLPDLYGDFRSIDIEPETLMTSSEQGIPPPLHFSRNQLDRLVRDIDRSCEINFTCPRLTPNRITLRMPCFPSAFQISVDKRQVGIE